MVILLETLIQKFDSEAMQFLLTLIMLLLSHEDLIL